MQDKWKHCFVALIVSGAAACQKSEPPASTTPPESVTQSAKPGETPAGTPAAATGTAAPSTTAPAAAEASGTTLKVGDPAPALTLTLQDGKTVDLASLKGKQYVVYFYPKDDTPGCTVEAQGIRDEWDAFQKAGIQVFGVSMQDAASHTAFIEKHKLPFPLVVDADRKVTTAFGVPVRGGEFAARQTFLVGADGNIKQIWREVTPAEHAKQVLDAAGAPASTGAAPKAG
ncbi:MAG TPA: peroxiredoxin [Polyangiaceae bacterium]|jgi:peroxiredoxin Q/BCP|nr:peroxiredoxin [Polyangiaceae bacterium]